MAKQVKIGFDFTNFPLRNEIVPLFDLLTGETLKDSNDLDLFTEVRQFPQEFLLSKYALPIKLNVEETLAGKKPLDIEEIFPQSSEVSSTLLGIRRAEEQLSLFSDVSTYGLDDDNWEFQSLRTGRSNPRSWYERKHPFLEDRNLIKFIEGTEEQSLNIQAFPVNYSFPYGPKWEARSNLYNESQFKQYLRFVTFGKVLFEFYSARGFENYARKNFISDRVKIVESDSSTEIQIDETIIDNETYDISGFNAFYDVFYDENETEAFADIEKFTLTFLDIENNQFGYLRPTSFTNDDNQTLDNIISAIDKVRDEIRPGYRTNNGYIGALYSKQAFRYQPGRISGFTFGIRLNIDNSSELNICEWGASNSTDEYLFQLKGASFNIVRRSKIRLPSELLRRMNLQNTETITYQKDVYGKGIDNPEELFELTIPRNKFNGDTLDGNGPSGYILSFEDVTMFKIEFGWYGAIGAKFYAYIPVGNAEARWVLIHTLIIENGLGEPCLVNPNFKFKYLLNISNTQRIREPSFVYKYGASYYIDGGDEGAKKITSISSDPKTYFGETAFFGIHLKANILNSQGIAVENNKEIYPTLLTCFSKTEYFDWFLSNDQFNPMNVWIDDIPFSQTSKLLLWGNESGVLKQWGDETGDVELWGDGVEEVDYSTIDSDFYRINIKEILGSSDGVHFHYSTSLHNQVNPSTSNIEFTVSESLNQITIDSDYLLEENYDKNSKIIADGLYNTFVGTIQTDQKTFSMLRRTNYELEERSLTDLSQDLSGERINLQGQQFSGKIVRYDTVAASAIPLTSNLVKIHFLNPRNRDEDFPRHFSEFVFGFTNKLPKIVTEGTDQVLRFGDSNEEINLNLDEDLIKVEIPNRYESLNLQGEENAEYDDSYGGVRLNVDYRLPNPLGEDSGQISKIVLDVDTVDINYDQVDQDEFGYKLIFTQNPAILSQITGNGFEEIGIDNQETGITFTSSLQTDTNPETEEEFYFIRISDNITSENNTIQLKILNITDDWQLESFTEDGRSRFQGKRVFISKVLSFNIQPLYLVVGMKDYARINNVIIEQFFNNESYTYTPNFITSESRNDIIVNSGGSSQDLPPANFKSDDRLSGYNYDEQNLQPLRPGNIVSSFVLRSNEVNKINLQDIFEYDRKKIITGNLNNKAFYFTAESIANSAAGEIEASLTVRES